MLNDLVRAKINSRSSNQKRIPLTRDNRPVRDVKMNASLALNVSSDVVFAHRRSKLGMLLAWRRNDFTATARGHQNSH